MRERFTQIKEEIKEAYLGAKVEILRKRFALEDALKKKPKRELSPQAQKYFEDAERYKQELQKRYPELEETQINQMVGEKIKASNYWDNGI